MSENTDKKIIIKDRVIMLAFSIIVIWFNFIFLKESYNDKEYLFLLLGVFVQLCVYLYIHFTLKDKILPQNLFYVKSAIMLLTIFLEIMFYSAYLNNVLGAVLGILLLLIVLFHYLCTMGNQSVFYSYFQSWEWKSCWKDNDIKRIAGEQQSIIKRALINFVVILGSLSFMGYLFLYKYPLLTLSHLTQIVWFDADKLAEYINDAWVLNVYWYMILGITLLFYAMIFYFLIYNKYPCYNDNNTPLFGRSTLAHREATIRNTYTLSIFTGLLICYLMFNKLFIIRGLAILFLPCFVKIFSSRIYWLLNIFWIYPICVFVFWKIGDIKIITKALGYLIPIALLGISLIVVISIGIVIVNMLKSKKTTENSIYDKLNQKMKPWLGFNSRFVTESFINEKLYDFKELYEKTNSKKKYLFYIEYFFSNILNKNVVSLLEHKKLLWLKVFFNWTDALNSKSMVEVDWFEESSKKRKAIIKTMPTRNKANFEDPEGDVFTNLEIEEVANTKPSILLPFYVTGVIYLNVIPYFLIYNVVMLIIFTKLVDVISQMNIALFNILAYGYIGVMILIFMGFLLSIFMNSMAVWMAWKKYYRLQNERNTDALFFSIFKQRAIYQNINDYSKDEKGNTITNNYSRGLYPQFDIEKLDEITQKLSPKYHDLYSKKFPLYMEE